MYLTYANMSDNTSVSTNTIDIHTGPNCDRYLHELNTYALIMIDLLS